MSERPRLGQNENAEGVTPSAFSSALLRGGRDSNAAAEHETPTKTSAAVGSTDDDEPPSTRTLVAPEALGRAGDDSPDPVEAALAEALRGATRAGEWAVVAQLAGELEARRRARAEVVTLPLRRPTGGAR